MEVGDGVRVVGLMPRMALNVVLVGDGFKGSVKRIVRGLGDGVSVRALALTHVHPDHAGGAAGVVERYGCEVWVGAREAGHMARRSYRELAPRSVIYGMQQRLMVGGGCAVGRELVEGDEIGGGFVVVDAPGHSPGHVAYWRARDGVLIVGDVLWNMHPLTGNAGLREPPDVFTLDKAGNRTSIRKLAELGARVVVFGHGRPLIGGAERLKEFAATIG